MRQKLTNERRYASGPCAKVVHKLRHTGIPASQCYTVRGESTQTTNMSYYVEKPSPKFQARFWAATIPLDNDDHHDYVKENEGEEKTYTTHDEEQDQTYEGRHVHVWVAVVHDKSGIKKRITKFAAKQRMCSALRMHGWNITDVPYLAPLRDRMGYERYMDKTVGDDGQHHEAGTPRQQGGRAGHSVEHTAQHEHQGQPTAAHTIPLDVAVHGDRRSPR